MILRFLGILVVLAAAYLVGNGTTSLWDRDEPRYAQSSRQMLESGDWVVPHFLDEARLKKPVLTYWCQAAAMKWFGVNAWSARLPSVVATVLALAVLAIAVGRYDDARTATWTVFIYGTSLLAIAAAKMAITDALLTLFILSAQACLFRMYVGRGGWGTMVLMGLSIGLAGLTKGPVVIGVLVMTILALIVLRLLERIWPNPQTPPSRVTSQPLRPLRMILKLLVVLGVVAAVVGPWVWAIETRIPGYTLKTIYEEVFVRAGRAQEGHKGPPGYYLLMVWVTFFPWSLLLIGAVAEAWRQRHLPSVRFAIAAVIGPWIMFELVATKLPHYVLPTYAPLAYLVARALIRSAEGDTTEFHQPAWPNAVAVWAVIVAIVGIAPWAAAFFFHPLPWQTYVALSILTVWSIFFAVKVHAEFARRYPSAAGMWMGLGMLGYVFVLYTWVFPVSQYMRLSERVAATIPHDLPPGGAMMIDYKEPSLAFYQGGAIREQRDNQYLANTLPDQWPTWIVITDTIWRSMPEAAKDRLEVVSRTRGWNYADGGRIVEVLVLKKK
jgi:4-amino-4-deoxy-L-arabinose transferase-like glycosyltransferase